MDCLTPDDIYAAAKQLSRKIINTQHSQLQLYLRFWDANYI